MPVPQYNPQGLSPIAYPGTAPTWNDGTHTTFDFPSFDGKNIHGRLFLPPGLTPGTAPPLPVIYMHSPYDETSVMSTSPGLTLIGPLNALMADLCPRGYAVAVTNERGTGASGGYLQVGNDVDAKDVYAACAYIASQPWCDGNVGGWGLSLPATMMVRGLLMAPPALKCAYIADPTVDVYSAFYYDGVPTNLYPEGIALTALTQLGLSPGGNPVAILAALSALPDRAGFLTDLFVSTAPDPNGDRTSAWASRDARSMVINGIPRGPADVICPILYSRGFRDYILNGEHDAEWLAGLVNSPSVKTLRGQWCHTFPDSSNYGGVATLDAMFKFVLRAFYDKYLKGYPTNYESLPAQLVEDTQGRWRTAATPSEWPTPTTFRLDGANLVATPVDPSLLSGVEAVFTEAAKGFWTTPPFQTETLVSGPLTLDLWVTLDQADAHFTARVDVIDADGATIGFYGFGALDAQHRLSEVTRTPFPIGVKTLVHLNTTPHSMVIPPGGRLRLVMGGQDQHADGGGGQDLGGAFVFSPAGTGFTATVAVDAAHPSALHAPIVGAPAFAQLPTAYDGSDNPTAWTPF